MSELQLQSFEIIKKAPESFIPIWTRIHELAKKGHFPETLEIQFGVNFGSFDHCIVGEAHGFKGNYVEANSYCSYCSSLSVHSAMAMIEASDEQFYNFKDNLYTHIYYMHPEVLQDNNNWVKRIG